MIRVRRVLARALEALHLEVLLVPADRVLRRFRLGPRMAVPVLLLAAAALVASLPDTVVADVLGPYRHGVVIALAAVGGWGGRRPPCGAFARTSPCCWVRSTPSP